METPPSVSIIMPCFNAAHYLADSVSALRALEYAGAIELCMHDDASTDDTWAMLQSLTWTRGPLRISRSETNRGAGYARNCAIAASRGHLLCFNDADDVSLPRRLVEQVSCITGMSENEDVLVGCRFVRDPPDATRHYAAFLNSLDDRGLVLKQYREVPLILSTWLLSRRLWDNVGPFAESLAEDLDFFHRLMDVKGVRLRVACPSEALVVYRHSGGSLSSKTPRQLLVHLRVAAFERRVLVHEPWRSGFYIWGAGRDGRAFFAALRASVRANVLGFFDVDANKIKQGVHHELVHPRVLPVYNAETDLTGKVPFVVCVRAQASSSSVALRTRAAGGAWTKRRRARG